MSTCVEVYPDREVVVEFDPDLTFECVEECTWCCHHGVLLYARDFEALAAHADLAETTTSFRGEEGIKTLEEECLGGKNLGFNGKQCIHPSQVEAAARIFSPSEKEVEWAVRVAIADAKADKQGRGAWTLDGKMIDVPVARKAKAIVNKAELCGFDVKKMQEKWKDQEPE